MLLLPKYPTLRYFSIIGNSIGGIPVIPELTREIGRQIETYKEGVAIDRVPSLLTIKHHNRSVGAVLYRSVI